MKLFNNKVAFLILLVVILIAIISRFSISSHMVSPVPDDYQGGKNLTAEETQDMEEKLWEEQHLEK